MGVIQVDPGELAGAGTGIASVGRRVTELAGSATSRFCLGSPTATSASLNDFQVRWSGLLAEMGSAIEILGIGVGLAGSSYRQVDSTVMPPAIGGR